MAAGQTITSETRWLDATAVAQMIARRDVSPLEVVNAAIERVEEANPVLNAVIHRTYEAAQARAVSEPRLGPFAGVPFLLKDVGPRQAGVPQTSGNAGLKAIGWTPEADDVLGRLLRDAGLVTLGVTNAPEFGFLGITQPLAFGPTRNPWDLSRSVGGSSGGSAAAVAAGLVPLAFGGDGGGSIRIPAAWSGVIGLKPTRGRVPRELSLAASRVCDFALTRSVRDAARLLDWLNRETRGSPYRCVRRSDVYETVIEQPSARRRIGVVGGPVLDPLPKACRQAVERASELLVEAGHTVVEGWPTALLDRPASELESASLQMAVQKVYRDLEFRLGRPVEEQDVEPYLWAHARPSDPAPAGDLIVQEMEWQLQRASRLLSWWGDGIDLLLTPTQPEPPPRIDDLALETPDQIRGTERRHVTFTAPFNASGQPAISLPISWTEDGLPMGVQLVADLDREDQLLQVARELELLDPWQTRIPPFAAGIAAPEPE